MASSINAGDLFRVGGLVALEGNGAIVYIIGRRKEVLDNAASTAKHGNIHAIEGDATNKADLSYTIDHLEETWLLASLSEFRSHLWDWDSDAFTDTYAVNTTAVFFTLVAFLELLDEGNKRGNLGQRSQFIATSSIGAYNCTCLSGYAYDSSKAAVVHMVKQLSTGLVPYGIRANVITPGLYPSEMTGYLVDMGEKDGCSKQYIPEQRPGNIQDMAGVILFLTSRAGAYANSNVLLTEGGRLGITPSTY
ncbi:hypothetical protein DL769_006238 [Monosporascus sp. CRB-8-3]|nr:hypothetical protein DL769_006238 [Monosporascus sp. CRB-8-3]